MTTPTLDAPRTDQLRDFLMLEAAADVASAHVVSLVPPHHTGRRVAIASAAAVVLGGALFVGNVAVGGGPGPASVEAASAVAFVSDGEWTTIRLEDQDASPQTVLDELLAAGFDARIDALDATRTTDLDGLVTVHLAEPFGTNAGATTLMGVEPGTEGLLGLAVALPAGVEHPDLALPDGVEPPSAEAGGDGPTAHIESEAGEPPTVAAMEAWYEEQGVRQGDDGSISLRQGADLTIVVFTVD